MADQEAVDVEGWHSVVNFIENMAPHIGGVCSYKKEKDKFGDLASYDQYMKPRVFVSLLHIKRDLNAKKFKSNTDALKMFNDMFSNAIRFWYDPTPVEGKVTKQKQLSYEPRKNVVVLITDVHDFITKKTNLVHRLAGEQLHFKPWYQVFPGAAYVANQLEQWYIDNYSQAYYFYYRDGCYHGDDPEDAWEDPADYRDFIPDPIYLSEIFEKMYCGKFAQVEEVHADMVRMFDNALHYYGDDADFGAGKHRVALQDSFEKLWTSIVPNLGTADAKAREYLPRPTEPKQEPFPAVSPPASAPSAPVASITATPAQSHPAVQQQQQQQHLAVNVILQQMSNMNAQRGQAGVSELFSSPAYLAHISPLEFHKHYMLLQMEQQKAVVAYQQLLAEQQAERDKESRAAGSASGDAPSSVGQAEPQPGGDAAS